MDNQTAIAAAIAAATGLAADELKGYLETPPNPAMGDYAFPCFKLAKALRKAPPAIAAELMDKLVLPAGLSRVETAGGYLNFFADKASYASGVLSRVLSQGERYGASEEGKGGHVCIDYSSINIAKPFHIGHLSSTAIGNSLYRIYGFLGYAPVGINHLGDWGTQFGKMIVAFKKWGDEAMLEKGSVRDLVKLYVRFHDEAEAHPEMNDEARAWFKKIEDGDAEAIALFERFKAITMREVMRVYDMLDVHFDSYAGESFYNDKMQPIVEELREKNLLKLDQGAQIVDLSAYDMPPCIILRSDGATLYATRDLATAQYRHDTYAFAKSLYVVAYQQNLHFKQVFKVLELMGRDWVKDMEHVNFGMVSITDGTLSTRHGNVVYLEDVLNAAIDKTRAVMAEKSPDLTGEALDEAAKAVGVGAVVWGVLYSARIKDISFSYEKALNFDGETGPYVQYTHARCCSVLAKAVQAGLAQSSQDKPYDVASLDYEALSDEAATNVLKALDAFPAAICAAAEKNEPYLVARALMDVCTAYNKFYYDDRIMDAEPNAREARLALTDAARTVIKTGLYLLGLKAPERM
ncbi:MAG: arginine--tRNA ligase [Clostridia bacterium]|nr:arginine--tRNA ligase [Clostridia bacterium]